MMGGVWEALYRAVAAGVGCQFFAEHCWLPNLVPHLAGQGVHHRLTWQHHHRLTSYSFVSTATTSSDTWSPAAGGFGSTDTDPDCPWIAGGSSISMLEPAVGGWKHTILRSTKACHHMGSAHRGRRRKAVVVCRSPCASRDPAASPQTQPASATPTDPVVGRHSIHTDPAGAGATPTDPAVGGHSIPTDPAATDAAGRCTWR